MKKTMYILLLNLLIIPAFAQGPAYPYTVPNTWTLSISKNATGYFVYRAPFTTTCGTFAKLFTTALPATSTSYTDQNPPEGTYCYAATAVNSSGNESGLSNVASNIIIPLPPPGNFNAVVAKMVGGSDVIYAWKNPPGTKSNVIYCAPNGPPYKPAIVTYFPTTKVRITSPSGTNKCVVTAKSLMAESGASNAIKVAVP